jgi:hypothetical protein
VWTSSGALGAVQAARVSCVSVLVGLGWILGAVPLWPVAGLAALIGIAILVAGLAHRSRRLTGKLAHLLTVGRALVRSPVRAARLLGWVGLASGARVLAAVAICSAFSLRSPLVAGPLIVVALDLSGQLPLTPGNVGIASGAVAVALSSRGIGLDRALSAGIALHATEAAAGLVAGAAGALQLADISRATVRRWTPIVASALACFAALALTSVGIFADLT